MKFLHEKIGEIMAFISFKGNKKISDQKIPPASAWSHYSKKRSTAQDVGDVGGKPLLELEGVSLSYEGTHVIDKLSLTVSEGDYLSVIGENGSGKSTLMNAILGLKKVSEGKIKYHGVKREQIGVLPQQSPVEKDFPALVSEVVTSGCLNRCSKGPFLSKDAKKLAFDSMERLGITSLAPRLYRDLSGGQQQRVMLARALCAAEKMLVLDEPVSGLDVKSTADIYSLIYDLNRKERMTTIMVTHDIPSAIKYSTHILRINKDSIFFGTTEQYKALPEAQLYLAPSEDDEETEPYGEGGFRYSGGEK